MLQSNTIKLRAPEPEDLDLLYSWENNTTLWQYGNTVNPLSRFALKEFIANCSENIFETKQLRFMIVANDSSTTLGTLDIFDFDPFHQRAAIGILIDTPYQKNGYAKESIKLIKEYCFKWLNIHLLYAHIPKKNEASIALFSSCGFFSSGTLKSWIRVNGQFEDIEMMQCLSL